MGRTNRMPSRRRTPIFDALADRYTTPGGWKSDTEEAWALGAFMRGFTYLLVLQDVERPPIPSPPWQTFTEAWHATHPRDHFGTTYPPASLWDAIDATPNEHHPDL